MSIHLEWVIECNLCHEIYRERARLTTTIVDDDPVGVRQPTAEGYKTDGLGGWLCDACYQTWKDKR